MRKFISATILTCLFALTVTAQSQPIRFSDGKPQIAYHLFSTWADNYQTDARRGKTAAETILFTTGAVALAGSALTWFGGDDISRNMSGSPMDPSLKPNLTLGLGIGGGALLISGMIVAAAPIKDYRAIYADVFEEQDSEVQEAMAASVLRYQADRGKERRVTSFLMAFAVPLIAGAIQAGVNVGRGQDWSKDLLSTVGTNSWWMAGSVVSIFQKTPEERLYQRYLSTRDALYGSAK